MFQSLGKTPIISVVIPCYNQAEYLPDTLESLLGQTYFDWEGIIVNDGSPDNTEEIALAYIERDSRFKYVSKKNGGLSSARNCGIDNALGEYILPLDSDDILEATYLEKALNVFLETPATTLVYCLGNYFGVKEGLWDLHYEGYAKLLLGNAIFCSALFRKKDCLRIGGYDEKMRFGYEDWDFYIRLLNEQSLVYQIPEPLFNYRTKEVSMLTECEQNRMTDIHNYIYKKNIDRYVLYYGNPISSLGELMYYKRRVERYRNKWYRRLITSLRDLVRGIRKKNAVI